MHASALSNPLTCEDLGIMAIYSLVGVKGKALFVFCMEPGRVSTDSRTQVLECEMQSQLKSFRSVHVL